jgi:hypothetical protein
MTVVNQSDIKSGSKPVRDLFSLLPKDRDYGWLCTQTYSNDDLVEISYIVNNIESPHIKNFGFFNLLIQSQAGPFNSAVFAVYLKELNAVDVLIHLIAKTPNLSEKEKIAWLENPNIISKGFMTMVRYFFDHGVAAQCGISNTKSPYNVIFAKEIMVYGYSTNHDRLKDFLFGSLNSLTPAELDSWYRETLFMICGEDNYVAVDVLGDYPNTPENLLDDYFSHTQNTALKLKLALHKNFPVKKIYPIWKETENTILYDKLPASIKSLIF